MTDDERRWLEECFRSVRDDVAGVNARLDKLNGSVRAHSETLIAHGQAIGIVKWLGGLLATTVLGILVKMLVGP